MKKTGPVLLHLTLDVAKSSSGWKNLRSSHIMAILYVSAIAEDATAAPGNALSCNIVVSVTDANGVGVTGLVMPFFLVGSPLVPAGGAASRLLYADPAGTVSGVYLLQVQPAGGAKWKAGVYVWSVGVTRGTDHGQAVCSALMN